MIIRAYGEPRPQGSKRNLNRGDANRKVTIVEANANTPSWRSDVINGARHAIEQWRAHHDGVLWVPWDGAVIARLVFSVWRPKSVSFAKRPYPSTNPPGDLCKLARSTEDAMKAAGVYRDDSRIVEYTRLAKVYVGEDEEALDSCGAFIILQIKEPLKEISESGKGHRGA